MRSPPVRGLRLGVVLRASEERCEIIGHGRISALGYAAFFPTPRADRVSPGHLVAGTAAPDGTELVVWRWFDAVVLGEEGGLVRLWEQAHGEVLARPRALGRTPLPDCPARTGGSPDRRSPEPRTPRSTWTRCDAFFSLTDCGTTSPEPGTPGRYRAVSPVGRSTLVP
jgi:hypothetical protein